MAKKVKLVTLRDITKFGNFLARSIRSRLAWSAKLRKAVKLHTAKEGGRGTSITITVGEGSPDLGGMAKAFEYGSGIHRRGGGSKYLILPKVKKALWFYLDNPYPNAVIYEKPSGEIGITTQKVLHPGVAARPFVAPSVAEAYKRAVPDLALDIRKNIVEYLNLTVKEINSK